MKANSSTLRLLTAFAVCAVLAGVSGQAFAQAAPGVLGSIDAAYKPFQTQWYGSLKGAALGLFVSLMTIDFLVSSAKQALDHGVTTEAIVTGLATKFLRYGFFLALLKFSDTWLPAIVDSFRQLGAKAGGVTSVQPDAIVDKGVDVALSVFNAINKLGVTDKIAMALPMMLIGVVLFVCFLFVALQVLITNIEIYLVCGSGVILLGMGGSAWTKDMAVNVYKYAVQVGMKLMILTLVIGVGTSIMDNLVIDPDNLVKSVLAALGSVVTFAYLSIKAPALANGMISGSSSLSAGDMMGAAVGMAAGTVAAGAGAMAAGSLGAQGAAKAAEVAGSGVAGAAGLAQAAAAGFQSAADFGKSGVGAAMHAASEVASHGLGLGGSAMSSAAASAKEGFNEKVAGSTGAKIAQSIEGSRGGSMGPAEPSSASTPAPEAGSGSGAASPAVGAEAAAGSSAAPVAPASNDGKSFIESMGVPAAQAGGTAPGNAAGASLEKASGASGTGARGASGGEKGGGSSRGDGRTLQDRISGVGSFIPDDSSQAAHVAIDTNAQVHK